MRFCRLLMAVWLQAALTPARCSALSTTTFDEETGKTMQRTSKVNLVDLAGSERVSKTGAAGDTLKEVCLTHLLVLTECSSMLLLRRVSASTSRCRVWVTVLKSLPRR